MYGVNRIEFWALEQSYCNHSMTADDRRRAIQSARIAHHFAIAENGVTGKSGRKRHRQHGRALQEILDAATKVVTA